MAHDSDGEEEGECWALMDFGRSSITWGPGGGFSKKKSLGYGGGKGVKRIICGA